MPEYEVLCYECRINTVFIEIDEEDLTEEEAQDYMDIHNVRVCSPCGSDSHGDDD